MNRTWWRALVIAAIQVVWTGPAMAMYHPAVGRWLQRDPAGYADGMSLYQYGRSNPCARGDPSGRVVIGIDGWLGKGNAELRAILNQVTGMLNSNAERKKRIRGGAGEHVDMVKGHEGQGRSKVTRLLEEYRDRQDNGWADESGDFDCWEEEVILVGYSDGATLIWDMFNKGEIQKALISQNGPQKPHQYTVAFVGLVDLVRTDFRSIWGLSDRKDPLPLTDGDVIQFGINAYQEDPGGWKGTRIVNPSITNILVPNASHAGRAFSGRAPILDTWQARRNLYVNAMVMYVEEMDRFSP